MRETTEQSDSQSALAERLRRIEDRLDAIEQWQRRERVVSPAIPESTPAPAAVVEAVPVEELPGEELQFDLSLIGRTLIVFGGAYLLRAITETGVVPALGGVLLGLLYAVSWSLYAMRPAVGWLSAAHHGIATTFIALPLLFEATRKFNVLGAWSSALALLVVSAIVLTLAARRRLEGVAWTFTMVVIACIPLLMAVTSAIVPFALYLTILGVATVWSGYVLDWRLLRWPVAFAADVVLMLLAFLVVTNRLPDVSPAVAIAVSCFAFAAYLTTFAVRTLHLERDILPFEIAQTVGLLVSALGGAIWVAASTSTLELPLAIAMIGLAAGSYAVAFAFVPRHFGRPANFVFYSSLALLLIVAGGAFVASGFLNSLLWVALALGSGFLALRFRKSSLALHAAVYLFSGFVASGVLSLGMHALFLKVDKGWPVPSPGALLLLLACVAAAAIPPIERQGSFQLWTTAKLLILAELGWIGSALAMTATGLLFLNDSQPDPATVAVARTAVLAVLTVTTAWASRFPTLYPARLLCDALMGVLVIKLMWEDFLRGRPSTLFVSLAIVGAALIVTSRLRRRGTAPAVPAPLAA
jgi:hypothetical protein